MSPRGRGIDFEQRFRTSRWAEDLVISALNRDHNLLTVRLGLSEIQRGALLETNSTAYKIPDLLTYRVADLNSEETSMLERTDLVRTPLAELEPEGRYRFAIEKALVAFEVEFSPYRAAEMKDRHWQPRTEEHWNRRPLRNANPPTAPNIWVKEEDFGKLVAWEEHFNVPIVIIHLFDQESFAITLEDIKEFNRRYEAQPDEAIKLQVTTGIFKKEQVYDRVDAQGARERKIVFVSSPAAAMKVGDVHDVTVAAQVGLSSSKKYVAHTLFNGGRLVVSDEFLGHLNRLRTERR